MKITHNVCWLAVRRLLILKKKANVKKTAKASSSGSNKQQASATSQFLTAQLTPLLCPQPLRFCAADLVIAVLLFFSLPFYVC